jgi:hypothetical protein
MMHGARQYATNFLSTRLDALGVRTSIHEMTFPFKISGLGWAAVCMQSGGREVSVVPSYSGLSSVTRSSVAAGSIRFAVLC